MATVLVKVLAWDDSLARPSSVGYVRDSLIGLLRESTSIGLTDAKRLIRSVLTREVNEIVVETFPLALVFQNRLESLGATVELVSRSA